MLRRLFQSVTFFCVVSICFHLVSLGVLSLRRNTPVVLPAKPKPIEFEVVEKKPLPQNEILKQKQIVEQTETAINDEKPEKDYFLSRNNQVVKEQTKARNKGEFQNSDKKLAGKPAAAKKMVKASKPELVKPASIPTDGVDPLKALKPQMNIAEMVKESENSGGGASQSDDHLDNVVEGMETVLNTREFLYYGYYARIKSKIRQYWEPIIKVKISRILKQGRQLASSNNRITQIIIILDQSGELVKVQVVGESGLQDLDDAAIEAFRAAAPFPNPPKGMIEEDGKIRIRWDFILEA